MRCSVECVYLEQAEQLTPSVIYDECEWDNINECTDRMMRSLSYFKYELVEFRLIPQYRRKK